MAALPILKTTAIRTQVVGHLQGNLPVAYRAEAVVQDRWLRDDIGQGFNGREKIYAKFPILNTKGKTVWRVKQLEFNRTGSDGGDIHSVRLPASTDPVIQEKNNDLIRQFGVAYRLGPAKNTKVSKGAWLQGIGENTLPWTPAIGRP